MKIDNLDLDIIHNLQDDGRLSYRELGRKLGIPHTTIFTRVERLKRKGIIKKFSAIIHPHESGGQMGIVVIETPPSESRKVAQDISRFDEAKKVFRTFDGKVVVKAYVPNHSSQRGFEDFLTKLNGYPITVYAAHDVIKFDHSVQREIIEAIR